MEPQECYSQKTRGNSVQTDYKNGVENGIKLVHSTS